MALSVPKIVYPSGGGTTLTFVFPPRNLPYKTYEAVRHDNVASSGAVERIYERRDEFLNILMEYVRIGSDVEGWDDFIQYALAGGSFDYYPNSTVGTSDVYILTDTNWNAAFKQLGMYTFTLKLRKAVSDTGIGGGFHGESLTFIPSYTFAGLPAGAPAGSLARVTDDDTLYMSTGSDWILIGPADIDFSVPDGSITEDKLADGAVTPSKLDIAYLSLISDNLGAITSGSMDGVDVTNGTMTGTIFKTASSGERIEIDSTDGFRSYNSGGTLIAQFDGNTISFAASSLSGAALANASVNSGKLNVAARGWMQTSAFSVTDADTIAWSSGTFTASDGTAYSISSGNTGNMSARTFVYLDIGTSTTAYQVTTTAANAVGDGKVLIAVCQNNTSEAVFQVFGGVGGLNVDGSSIVAASVTANEIAASTIDAGKMNVTELSAIVSNLGTVLSGSVDSITITGSTIIGGLIATDVAGVGHPRVQMSNTDGLILVDSSDQIKVQILASVYAGIQLNGLRSIDTNDIFMEAQDQSVQLFVSQASARVSFAIGGATRGYVDGNGHQTGGGNLPTGHVMLVNNSLKRLSCQQGTGPGFGYAYFT